MSEQEKMIQFQLENTLKNDDITMNMLLHFQNELLKQTYLYYDHKIFMLIQEYIIQIKNNTKKLEQILEQANYEHINVEKIGIEAFQFQNNIKLSLLEWLKNENMIEKDFLIGALNEEKYSVKSCVNQKQNNLQFKKLNGQTICVSQRCFSFVFNTSMTLLFVGQARGIIKVFGFNTGKKIIRILQFHTNVVSNLIWMKNSKQLVSGSLDGLIIFWDQVKKDKTMSIRQILKQNHQITSLKINDNQDLLISGNRGKQIIFWKKEKLGWKCELTIQVGCEVVGLSLNDRQNTVVCCGPDYKGVKVIKLLHDEQWTIVQEIKEDQYGFRIGFINEDAFLFQPQFSEYLSIFHQNEQQFFRVKQLKTNCFGKCMFYFPIQVIKPKNIIVVKHSNYINVFKSDQEDCCQPIQSIRFNSYILFGRLTDNGEFLVTWDGQSLQEQGSNQIQIRMLQYTM